MYVFAGQLNLYYTERAGTIMCNIRKKCLSLKQILHDSYDFRIERKLVIFHVVKVKKSSDDPLVDASFWRGTIWLNRRKNVYYPSSQLYSYSIPEIWNDDERASQEQIKGCCMRILMECVALYIRLFLCVICNIFSSFYTRPSSLWYFSVCLCFTHNYNINIIFYSSFFIRIHTHTQQHGNCIKTWFM